MNRREFTLALGAAVVAGGVPATAKPWFNTTFTEHPERDIPSGGLSVIFDYEDGVKVGPLPAVFTTRDVLTFTSSIGRSGTVIGASLYVDDKHLASATLTHKQSVFQGCTAERSWPAIRMEWE
jgi:hypothetical protein